MLIFFRHREIVLDIEYTQDSLDRWTEIKGMKHLLILIN